VTSSWSFILQPDLSDVDTVVLLLYILQVLMQQHSFHKNKLAFRELRKCSWCTAKLHQWF